jgi:WhiB family redox-sensing transcriptional regulator
MTTSTRLTTRPASHAPADTGDWRDDAACRVHEDPDLWFPSGDSAPYRLQIHQAKTVCLTQCAVREECLAYALAERLDIGVWGGLSEGERRRLHRRKARVYARRFLSAVDHILTNRLEEFRELEAQGLKGFEIARALGTNASTVIEVRERLAKQEQGVAA